MESLGEGTSRTITPVYFTSRQVFLPTEIIFHLSHFLEFQDFRNFVRAMWPQWRRRRHFQRKTTGNFQHERLLLLFLNGKTIEVEYNYDRERFLEDRVKINLQSMLPILGEVELPDGNEFVNTLTMKEFLYKNVKLHKCEQGIYSSCGVVAVDLDEEERDVCPHHHFHHHRPRHINRWLREYLSPMIALKNGQQDFVEMIEFTCGEFAHEIVANLWNSPLKLLQWFYELTNCSLCLDDD